MQISIPKEKHASEKRVAVTPDIVKKYISMGFKIVVESGAGIASNIRDQDFISAGAEIAKDSKTALQNAQIILAVQNPVAEDIPAGSILIAMLNPYNSLDRIKSLAQQNVCAMSMELMPRITRAQNMDVLSSQSNLAGYRAVIEASEQFTRAFPMMMTAAGTIPPARVLVMGAGVAGLQAIATARRLGAIVSATDVRMAAKEQVASLGATFVMVENEETRQAETSGGYAKEMSAEYKRLQSELIAETIKKQDIVICTALIPGRPAPRLVSEDMVRSMKSGSVIVDMAVEQGGNCALSQAGKVVDINGVKIIGYENMPSRIPSDASMLYAKNIYNFMTLIAAKTGGAVNVNMEDEIIRAITITHNGKIIHPQFIKETV